MIKFFAKDLYKNKTIIISMLITWIIAFFMPIIIFAAFSSGTSIDDVDRNYKITVFVTLASAAICSTIILITIFNYRERYDLLLFSLKYTRKSIFFKKLLVVFLIITAFSFMTSIFLTIGLAIWNDGSGGFSDDGFIGFETNNIMLTVRLFLYLLLLNLSLVSVILPFSFIKRPIVVMMSGLLVIFGFFALNLLGTIPGTASYEVIMGKQDEEESSMTLDYLNDKLRARLNYDTLNFLPKLGEMEAAIESMDEAIYGDAAIGQVSRKKNSVGNTLIHYFNLPIITFSLLDGSYSVEENSSANDYIEVINGGKMMVNKGGPLDTNSFLKIEKELGQRFGALSSAFDEYDALLKESLQNLKDELIINATVQDAIDGVEWTMSTLETIFGSIITDKIFDTRNSSGKLLGQIDEILIDPDAIVNLEGEVVTINNDNIKKAYLTILNIAAQNTDWVKDVEYKYLVNPLYQYLIFVLFISSWTTLAYFRHKKVLIK